MSVTAGFSIALIVLFSFTTGKVSGAMHMMETPMHTDIGANFPCKPELKVANSQGSQTKALICGVRKNSEACVFIMSDASLDMEEYRKSGINFIKEILNQYAKGLNAVSRIESRVAKYGSVGAALHYDFIAQPKDGRAKVVGVWIVNEARLNRLTVTCAPTNSNFMMLERENFLNSFSVVK